MATLSLQRGNSATAEYLAATQPSKNEYFDASASLSKRLALSELISVWNECNTPNWDGYNALPVNGVTAQNAYQFIRALSIGTPLPSVGAEPDGSIALEWYQHSRWILSVSVNSTRTIYYAALFGVEKASGSVPFLDDEIPATIVNLVQRVQMHD